MSLGILRSNIALTCLLPMLCLGGCSRENLIQSEWEDVASITAVSKARADAFNQGNAAGISAHFVEDALLMAPDKPTLKGKAAVQAYYQHIFNEYDTELNSYYEEVKVAGDFAYGRGFAEILLTPKRGGLALKSTAKYINILKRQPDGTWKTTHDIWNGNESSP
jgi:uncharacterized protein (TIGR02246 family)